MFHVEHYRFGVYVHVPFCISKCAYCDFCRVTDLGLKDAYLATLAQEINTSSAKGQKPSTIYIGGGTPSSLGPDGLARLLNTLNQNFDLTEVKEFTVECNPEDVTPQLAQVIKEGHANRVSMGAQSLFDPALRMMGRRHNANRVEGAILTLRQAGIDNISVDCIFGLPHIEGYDPEDDFRRFAALGVEHLSAYALQYEEGSRFTKMLDEGRLTPASEDETVAQYEALTRILHSAGYAHYEISNYARPGREAVHNSSYWDRTDYYGFGPAASSFINGVRTTNTYDVAKYINSGGQEKQVVEHLTEEEIADEVVMLSLRTSRGLSLTDLPDSYRAAIEKLAEEEKKKGNIATLENGRLRIPEERWMVSDMIIRNLTNF